ncbi:MAG: response regulator transcription factor [Tissierellales bacterium]|nr:response regulator transcription factor [Tissierellales bacterium]
MIKLMIVDDQTLMRDGLKTIIELEEDIDVVALAEDGEEAVKLNDKINPDVILMDIRMPIMNGVESVKAIKKVDEDVSILMLTTFDDEEYIIEALAHGADGYLLKDIAADQLIDYIRAGYKGEIMLPAKIARKLAVKLREQEDVNNNIENINDIALENFSQRELEIAKKLSKGLTNKQIAKELFISEGTVKNYISTIYSKLGTNDRTKVVLLIQSLLDDSN